MEPRRKQYQFVNSLTGNVIGYLSVAKGITPEAIKRLLEEKKAELAIANHLRIDLIYWLLPD